MPLPNETARLRALISKPGWRLRFTAHSRKEMQNDDIRAPDVDRVLRYGGVTWVETKKDVLWHVEGRDIDGRSIRLVVAADEAELCVKLVTAMTLPD